MFIGYGKNWPDMSVEPPPDLAIEIDLSSRTPLENYQLLRVPELGRYTRLGLQISILQAGIYAESDSSPTFPNIPIIELVNRYVQQSQVAGRTPAIQGLRSWMRENL